MVPQLTPASPGAPASMSQTKMQSYDMFKNGMAVVCRRAGRCGGVYFWFGAKSAFVQFIFQLSLFSLSAFLFFLTFLV